MAFLNVGSAPEKKQRLYIMEITLPTGMRVTKIGKASGSSSKERMLQINSSIFDKYRCTAMISIKRDRSVPADKVFEMESVLHRFFKDYKYKSKKAFSGVTECFVVPLEDVVQAYELVIEGTYPDFTYELVTAEDNEYGLPF